VLLGPVKSRPGSGLDRAKQHNERTSESSCCSVYRRLVGSAGHSTVCAAHSVERAYNNKNAQAECNDSTVHYTAMDVLYAAASPD